MASRRNSFFKSKDSNNKLFETVESFEDVNFSPQQENKDSSSPMKNIVDYSTIEQFPENAEKKLAEHNNNNEKNEHSKENTIKEIEKENDAIQEIEEEKSKKTKRVAASKSKSTTKKMTTSNSKKGSPRKTNKTKEMKKGSNKATAVKKTRNSKKIEETNESPKEKKEKKLQEENISENEEESTKEDEISEKDEEESIKEKKTVKPRKAATNSKTATKSKSKDVDDSIKESITNKKMFNDLGIKLSEEEAEVYIFLLELGRPVGMTEIVLYFKNTIKKLELVKILGNMKKNGQINMKPCIKTPVMAPITPIIDENINEEYKQEYEKIIALEKKTSKTLKDNQLKLKIKQKEKTEKDFEDEIEAEKKIIEKLEREIEKIGKLKTVDANTHQKLLKNFENNKVLLKKCKNGYKDLKGMLTDGLCKKWSEIKEDIGLE